MKIQHPYKTVQYIFSVFITLFIAIFFTAAILSSLHDHRLIPPLVRVASYTVVILLIAQGRTLYKMGQLLNNSIPVNDDTFPDVFLLYRQCAEALSVQEPPALYSTVLLSKSASFQCGPHDKKRIFISNRYLISTDTHTQDRISFIFYRELFRHRLLYSAAGKAVLPALLVPPVYFAYLRHLELYCDFRAGEYSPNGARNSLLLLIIPDGYGIPNEKLISSLQKENTLLQNFSEFLSPRPSLYRRFSLLKDILNN